MPVMGGVRHLLFHIFLEVVLVLLLLFLTIVIVALYLFHHLYNGAILYQDTVLPVVLQLVLLFVFLVENLYDGAFFGEDFLAFQKVVIPVLLFLRLMF